MNIDKDGDPRPVYWGPLYIDPQPRVLCPAHGPTEHTMTFHFDDTNPVYCNQCFYEGLVKLLGLKPLEYEEKEGV